MIESKNRKKGGNRSKSLVSGAYSGLWVRLDRASVAVQGKSRVSPGSVAGCQSYWSQAEIASRRARRVVLLKSGQLFPAGRFHPAQPLEIGEIDHKGMVTAATGLVRR